MDRDKAESILLEIQEEYAECMEQKAAIDARMNALLTIMDGLDQRFPGLVVEVTPPKDEARPGVPRGKDAVRAVLAWADGQWMTVAEVWAGLERRGWSPASPTPQAPVRTALERLIESDVNVDKLKDATGVRYRFELPEDAEVRFDALGALTIDRHDGEPIVIPPLPLTPEEAEFAAHALAADEEHERMLEEARAEEDYRRFHEGGA
jgi:hypothetical protein